MSSSQHVLSSNKHTSANMGTTAGSPRSLKLNYKVPLWHHKDETLLSSALNMPYLPWVISNVNILSIYNVVTWGGQSHSRKKKKQEWYFNIIYNHYIPYNVAHHWPLSVERKWPLLDLVQECPCMKSLRFEWLLHSTHAEPRCEEMCIMYKPHCIMSSLTGRKIDTNVKHVT